jgi:hypothetical protein
LRWVEKLFVNAAREMGRLEEVTDTEDDDDAGVVIL